jgi:hypothetical protein
MASASFWVYAQGKKHQCYKYEEILNLLCWYDKQNKRQIDVTLKSQPDTTTQTWGLTEDDVLLTQQSHAQAEQRYNETIIEIAKAKSSKHLSLINEHTDSTNKRSKS